VLQNLGVVEDLLAEAEDVADTARAAAAAALLRKILAAGGERIVDAVTGASGPEIDGILAAAETAKVRAA
jgi:hypothetical protein